MTHDVVVVGGGIGGLTVAALLAVRGMDVCLLERQSEVGGCVARSERFGYSFEPTVGLYSSWGQREIHERIFAELPVEAPETRNVDPAYVVRLPGSFEVAAPANQVAFHNSLRLAFPECAEGAIKFYSDTAAVSDALLRALGRVPDLRTAKRVRRFRAFIPEIAAGVKVLRLRNSTAAQELRKTSVRFRSFIDAQLQLLTQTSAAECAYLAASIALNLPRRGLFNIRGGASELAARLADSIRKSGGTIRLNTPVLRLSYDAAGSVSGVDLLSGETIRATRAIVSNMTVWDTFGKLIGVSRTPMEWKQKLASVRGQGAYVIFAGMDAVAAGRLPAEHLLVVTQGGMNNREGPAHFSFAAAPDWDPRAPQGMRAVTICLPTDVDEWFSFQADPGEHDELDQATLERAWHTIHHHIPELGGDIEVIDTLTPRTYYDLYRRKLGMVLGVGQALDVFGLRSISHLTSLPNVFMVGDTVFPGAGVAGVSHSALIVADTITG